MQIHTAPAQTGKITLRSGAAIGILLGVIHSIITIVNTLQDVTHADNSSLLTTLFYLVTPLVWIVGLLFAGAWTSKFTGKVSSGTLAGLFAGLFGGLVADFGQAIATAISTTASASNGGSTNSLLALGFVTIFYTLVLALGAGAGCGALGGLIGQTVSDVRPMPSQPHPIPAAPVYQPPVMPYGYMQQVQTPMPPIQEGTPRHPEQ